jgi:hypothetical protein
MDDGLRVKLRKDVVALSTRESFPASGITCAVAFSFPPEGRSCVACNLKAVSMMVRFAGPFWWEKRWDSQ